MAELSSVAVQAQWRAVKFWCQASSDTYAARIVVRETPGADGADTIHAGRKPRRTTLTAFVQPEEIAALAEAVEKETVGNLQHPYLGAFDARLESLEVSANADTLSHATANLTFIEHKAQALLLAKTIKLLANSAAETKAIFSQFDGLLGDLGDLSAISSGLDSTATTLQAEQAAFSTQLDGAVGGTVNGPALARGVVDLTAGVRGFMTEAELVTDSLGLDAREIMSLPFLSLDSARDAVTAIDQAAPQSVQHLVMTTIDLFSVLYGAVGHADDIQGVMARNGILDPFLLFPGTTLTLDIKTPSEAV